MYFRSQINRNKYEDLDNCTDVSLLTSTFKLFLRELPEPLICNGVRDQLYSSIFHVEDKFGSSNVVKLVQGIKKSLVSLSSLTQCVLHCIILHMRRVADDKGKRGVCLFKEVQNALKYDVLAIYFYFFNMFNPDNKMDAHNVAIVFSPNMIGRNKCGNVRPEQMLMEMDWNNTIVEKLIIHVNQIFEK